MPPPRPGRRREIVPLFDADGDGRLGTEERRAAREAIREQRREDERSARGPGGFRPPRPGGLFPGRPARSGAEAAEPQPGRRIAPEAVESYPRHDLYDPTILRTLFIDFEDADWEDALDDFVWSDVDIPATLTVDGERYEGVGIRLRGTSSLMFAPPGRKRSLNVSLTHVKGSQRLHGHRTLNLLNSYDDPTFLRVVLYNQIARSYVPAPRANLVHVVLQGESWGVFVSQEQFNKDYIDEWYGTRGGSRWKVVGEGRRRSFSYQGRDVAAYAGQYVLKSGDEERAWRDLVEVCEILDRSDPDCLEDSLARVFDIDRALWMLAIDNVLINVDGYIFSPTSDFDLYEDPSGRFHPSPRDANETFRETGRYFREQMPADAIGIELSPLAGADDPGMPLVHGLLASQRLRARYLAHVRTVVEEWLDWERLGPIVARLEALIVDEVRADTRKLGTFEEFASGLGDGYEERSPRGVTQRLGLRRFVEARRAFLLDHPALNRPTPRIERVEIRASREALAWLAPDVEPDEVLLHWAVEERASKTPPPFRQVELLRRADGAWTGPLPSLPAGTRLRFYVEALSLRQGSAAYSPARAELGARTWIIGGEATDAR